VATAAGTAAAVSQGQHVAAPGLQLREASSDNSWGDAIAQLPNGPAAGHPNLQSQIDELHDKLASVRSVQQIQDRPDLDTSFLGSPSFGLSPHKRAVPPAVAAPEARPVPATLGSSRLQRVSLPVYRDSRDGDIDTALDLLEERLLQARVTLYVDRFMELRYTFLPEVTGENGGLLWNESREYLEAELTKPRVASLYESAKATSDDSVWRQLFQHCVRRLSARYTPEAVLSRRLEELESLRMTEAGPRVLWTKLLHANGKLRRHRHAAKPLGLFSKWVQGLTPDVKLYVQDPRLDRIMAEPVDPDDLSEVAAARLEEDIARAVVAADEYWARHKRLAVSGASLAAAPVSQQHAFALPLLLLE
jgi:hypothetical protein